MNKLGIPLFYQDLIVLILLVTIVFGILYFYFYRKKQQKVLLDLKQIHTNYFLQGIDPKTTAVTDFPPLLELNPKFNSKDHQFLKNIISIIENDIHNSEFGVENLAVKIGLSTSQLNRKMKAITNQTTINSFET